MIRLTVAQLGDVWNRMTPIERGRLGLEAGLEPDRRGTWWIELWPEEKRAIRRAYERRHSEPVRGEQAGMFGVPGKYVEQKRPWTPGQMGFESYAKYVEAMDRKYSLTELREMCRERGISASGDKKTLVRRLF